jgi:heat shock protein HslJ
MTAESGASSGTRCALGIAAILLTVVAVGCSGAGPSTDELHRRQFEVVEVDGDAPPEVGEAVFRFTRTTMGWTGVCNAHGGDLALVDGRIEIDQLSGTDAGCDDP